MPEPYVAKDPDNGIPVAKRRNSIPRLSASRFEEDSRYLGMGPCMLSKGGLYVMVKKTPMSLSDFELYHVLQCFMNSTFYRHRIFVSFQNKQMLHRATNRLIIAVAVRCAVLDVGLED